MIGLLWWALALLVLCRDFRRTPRELERRTALLSDAQQLDEIRWRIRRERWGVDEPDDFGGRRERDRTFEPCPGDWLS